MNINDLVPRATSCEWPVSEDSNGVTFCCAKVKDGYSYCEKHHAMAYESKKQKAIDEEDIKEIIKTQDEEIIDVVDSE